MNKLVIAIVVVLVVFVGWNVVKGPADVKMQEKITDKSIKMGFIAPLSGDTASIGEPMRKAVELAVNEVNEKGGINGAKIEMVYEDGKCNGTGAINAVQKLINTDNVKVIIGGACSGETLAAAPVAEKAKVILFSPGSGSPDVTNAGDYVFRNFPSDASSGSKIAEVAIEKGITKIGVLSETVDYSQAVKKVFLKRFTELGGTVVADEQFQSGANDLRSNISKIIDSGAQGLYFLPSSAPRAELGFTQIRQSKFSGQIFSNEFVPTDDFLKKKPKLVEGVIYAEPAFDEKAERATGFIEKYRAKYGKVDNALPPFYLATSYDSVFVLANAIAKVGYDAEKIKNELYTTKDFDGIAGKLTLDSNGDPVFEYNVKQIISGSVTLLK